MNLIIPKSFPSLEGLRAWMAWWVVFGHAIHLAGAPAWLSEKVRNILVRGDVAVNVFIILSGFVITHLLLTKHEKYFPYITRRFFRVFPVYVFCLVLALLSIETYKFAYIELPYAEHASMRLERLMEGSMPFCVETPGVISVMLG